MKAMKNTKGRASRYCPLGPASFLPNLHALHGKEPLQLALHASLSLRIAYQAGHAGAVDVLQRKICQVGRNGCKTVGKIHQAIRKN